MIIASGAESRTLRTSSEESMLAIAGPKLRPRIASASRLSQERSVRARPGATSARLRTGLGVIARTVTHSTKSQHKDHRELHGHRRARIRVLEPPCALRAAPLLVAGADGAGRRRARCVDERAHLGFTQLAQCLPRRRVSRCVSLLSFTLELLPIAVLGALLGGLLVQFVGGLRRGATPAAALRSLRMAAACSAWRLGLLLCALLCRSRCCSRRSSDRLVAGRCWCCTTGACCARIRRATYPSAAKCVVGLISARGGARRKFPGHQCHAWTGRMNSTSPRPDGRPPHHLQRQGGAAIRHHDHRLGHRRHDGGRDHRRAAVLAGAEFRHPGSRMAACVRCTPTR